ncbi:hypothetical protein [Psychroflexus sp. MES1-P1E]|uniref:hypothetical protein n=1 Tax=Psychroflexus sp. MES1-P1E TaxID=2058320 RepID=UPI000C7C42AB|nr:hypothetical protein [Psychroflexus sp. MES1-P1E]PKG42699.1 hypothetical protein CXF67_08865 [Psychroflexus sp. MES1-P1E]
MKKTNYILLVALILSVSLVQSQEEKVSKFSWDDILESKADIGAFPYITAPNRLIVDKKESQSYEFDKLEMFNGSSFFVLDGKVERMTLVMDGDKKWENIGLKKAFQNI